LSSAGPYPFSLAAPHAGITFSSSPGSSAFSVLSSIQTALPTALPPQPPGLNLCPILKDQPSSPNRLDLVVAVQ